MDLLTIMSGTFSIIIVLTSYILGAIILTRYFKHKVNIYLYFGVAALLIAGPWWASAFSFIFAIFNNGIGIPIQLYFLLTFTQFPFYIYLWLVVYSDLVHPDKKLIIRGSWIIYSIIYYTTFFIQLFFNYDLLGTYDPYVNPVNVE